MATTKLVEVCKRLMNVNSKVRGCGTNLLLRYYTNVAGVPGSGAGKGGGAGGAVRESGGGLGRLGAAREESYFFEKQKRQLRDLKRKQEVDKKDSPSNEKKIE